jgi:hypothetical protein
MPMSTKFSHSVLMARSSANLGLHGSMPKNVWQGSTDIQLGLKEPEPIQ